MHILLISLSIISCSFVYLQPIDTNSFNPCTVGNNKIHKICITIEKHAIKTTSTIRSVKSNTKISDIYLVDKITLFILPFQK